MGDINEEEKSEKLIIVSPSSVDNLPVSANADTASTDSVAARSAIPFQTNLNVANAAEKPLKQGPKTKEKPTRLLILSSIIAAFPGIADGFASSVVNNSRPAVFQWFADRGSPLTTASWAFSVSLHPLGGLVGSILAAPLVRHYGPHKTQFYNNVMYLFSSLLFIFTQNLAMLDVARFFAGLAIGISSPAKMIYIGEISPAHLRGPMSIVTNIVFIGGMVFGLVLGMHNVMGTPELWRYLYGLTIVAPLVHFPFSFVMPESPRFLFNQGRVEEARKAINRLRGHENNDWELAEYQKAKEREAKANMSFFSGLKHVFTSREMMKPLSIVLFIPFIAPYASCNFVTFYSNQTFAQAGLSNGEMAAVLGGVCLFLSSLTMYPLVERAGRRWLLLGGWTGSGIGATMFCIASVYSDSAVWNKASIGFLLMTQFFGFFAFGSQMVLSSELFPTSLRSIGVSLAQIVNRISQFIMTLAFPFISDGLGDYTFLLATVASVMGCAFVIVVIPETTSLTMEQIQDMLHKKGGAKGRGSKETP